MNSGIQLIERDIVSTITDSLDKVGVLYRLFSRTKEPYSINDKIARKEMEGEPYEAGKKLMQDLIGIRIVTYFSDDVAIVYDILKSKLEFISEEIDLPNTTVFKPKRTNIICRLVKENAVVFDEVKNTSNGRYNLIDNTFELQLRTVLSEGWHEVDHSLRYKCKDQWLKHEDSERLLNGIYASLETNDVALKTLFNDLSYKHYKEKNWEGMLRNKFRLKFINLNLSVNLSDLLTANPEVAKKILRANRGKIIYRISMMDIAPPISFDTIVYLTNMFECKCDSIFILTPEILKS